MPAYRRKPIQVEARQFEGTFDHATRLESWLGRCYVDFSPERHALTILALGADPKTQQTVRKGDWIVKRAPREFYACTDEVFGETHEAVESD